ncbi:MAG: hypothetical protein V2J07_07310 [Anaerolineae bacterium]|jgi:hypothetical protein|nr:hypothetical protein [Anaerolineae bacterium]
MEKPNRQVYRQKPWRTQMKWLSQILVAAFFFLLISALYLGLASQVAAISERNRDLQTARIKLQESIASLESELAAKQSGAALAPRMETMKFEFYEKDDLVFIPVKGYSSKEDFQLAPFYYEVDLLQPVRRTQYTQSLWDIIHNTLNEYGFTTGGIE